MNVSCSARTHSNDNAVLHCCQHEPPTHVHDAYRYATPQVAHVDHGKTTLVDALFRASLGAKDASKLGERAMDTGELEQERGITILSKVTALRLPGPDGEPIVLNIVDTPGHADFGEISACAVTLSCSPFMLLLDRK